VFPNRRNLERYLDMKKQVKPIRRKKKTDNADQKETPAAMMKPAPLPGADKEDTTKSYFPIVGIGASAGGLAAFEAFFSGMPANTDPGMAFVLVQHLAPDHKSILTDLIRRYTRMQVFEVEDGMKVLPNCAYIIPPNRDMAFLNGTLQLMEPAAPRGQRLPIDFFFRSLAHDQHERAICIVLSGTGSDGTLGVRAIKGEGGMAMAQNPASTEYDGMPRSAIGTGLVDYELPPAEMPAQIIAYVAHAFGKVHPTGTTPAPKAENALKKIFILLRAQTGHDFSQYKTSTINRRIERRMAVNQIATMDGYIKHLQQEPTEVEALFRDMLIGVTNFFRDPEAFTMIEEQVVPKLFTGKGADSAIRVWVPGCSTGEEAYSLAILLAERQEAMKRSFKVQIFATDIDNKAINIARAGIYPASISADISRDRLKRFFSPEPDASAYRIHKGIRDLLVFSEQNVIKDPPFSKLDLISCRNLLIYLNGDLQRKTIPLFHYSLNPGGFLFLGTSETVGDFDDLFAAHNRKLKLYQRKDNFHSAGRVNLGQFLPPISAIDVSLPRTAGTATVPRKLPLRELTEQALLQQVISAGALVNSNGDILYLHGRTGLYLEPTPGEAGTNNILKMAREGLRRDLTIAMHKTVATKDIVRHDGLRVKTNGNFATINLIIRPVAAAPATSPDPLLYLVILEEASGEETRPAKEMDDVPVDRVASHGTKAATRIEELQQALKAKEEYLQTANEELATVNNELQTKVTDLSRMNNDMNNLLAGTGIATVFVDHNLKILRFTPSATLIINLIQSDIGRPVGHIVSNLKGYDSLVADVKAVLEKLIPRESEVQSNQGMWYTMRITPYRTTDNVIEGAVITFVDITEMKKIQDDLRKANDLLRLAVVVRDAHDAITVQDLDGHIIAWNPGAVRMYGWSETEALAMNVRDRIPEGLRKDALDKVLQLSRAEILEPHITKRIAKNGSTLEVSIISTALVNEAGQMYAIATTEREKVKAGE